MSLSEDKLLYRRAILLQLEVALPVGLPPKTLLDGLALSGFARDLQKLERTLDYLSQKGFVEFQRSQISAGSYRVKLTASGSDYLESGGF